MSYVSLHRGIAQTQEKDNFPIFPINGDYVPSSAVYRSFYYNGQQIYLTSFTSTTNLLNLFPASIPRNRKQTGAIIASDFFYEFNAETNRYIVNDMQLENCEVGVKPSDFDSKPQDYYTLESAVVDNKTITVYAPIISGANTQLPSWSNTTLYYHDISPRKNRITRLYCTDANYYFGFNFNIFKGNGYTNNFSAQIFVNPLAGYSGGNNDISRPHFPTGTVINYLTLQNIPTRIDFSNILNNPNIVMFFISYWQYVGIAIVTMSDSTDNAVPVSASIVAVQTPFWGTSIKDGNVPGVGNWGDDSDTGGGNGTFTATSNNRGDATGTAITTQTQTAGTLINNKLVANFLSIYHVSSGDMAMLTGMLYGQSFFDKFKQYMYNPLSAVLSCHLLPSAFVPVTGLAARDYTAGGYNFTANMDVPTQGKIIGALQNYHVGSINIASYFDSFPDYNPYTKCTLHLPYIGTIDIDINAIVKGKLSVDYICDVTNGNIAAWVYCLDENGNSTFKYIATGNCAYNIPLFTETQSGAALGKILTSAVSGALSFASGNAVAGAGAIVGGVFGAATQSRQGQVSGNLSGNVGAITDSVCWVEIERPKWVNPETFKQLRGIPSEIGGTISELGCTGFTSIDRIELDAIPCTESEKISIATLLKSGIIISE